MSKKILPLIFFLSFSFFKSYSQDFLGLSTGNYSGITGVSLQPASIVDSRHKFDINLFSTGVNYSNNYFLLDRNAILKFNKNTFNNYGTFKDDYLSEASLPAGEKAFFNINNRTQLPLSFMATTGKKSAIALNMQFRTMVQGRGISQDFAKLAFNDFYHGPLTNTNIDASGLSVNSLSWAEIGFTYGRVLFSSGEHFLKGAITGKYLAGLSSVNLSSNDLQLRINSDSTFDFRSSNVSYNHNKNADFDKLIDKNFRPDANSFGLDAGLVYEYRGNIDKFKYLKSDDEKSYDALRRDVNKYIFKLGVSLLDVGMFNFDKPADVNSFSANINNWDIRNAHYKSIKNFDTALANRVIANPNDPLSYNVYLPTALSAQLDVKFVKGLFLNVMSYWPVNLGDEPGQRFDKFGYYTITPRFETRHFGIYIPYTVTQRNDFTDYKQHMLGATVRLGPLFIGSSNLGSMLFNNQLKSADVHVGLKIGFTYGKPNKSTRVLGSIFKEEPADTMTRSLASQKEFETDSNGKRVLRDKKETYQSDNRLLLDYKDGKIFDNPGAKPNIIIINNYYYGTSPEKAINSKITLPNEYPKYNADSAKAVSMEIARLQNKLISDSISRVTTDSLKVKRQQLDSLIKSMQQLQRQMDNTNRTGINVGTDSTVYYNGLRRKGEMDKDDTFAYEMDSVQSESGKALMVRKNSIREDSIRGVDSRAQDEQSPAVKKKVKPALDSVLVTNKTVPIVAKSNEVIKTDSLNAPKNNDNVYQQDLQRMQDSLDHLSKRFSDITDSLTRVNKITQEKTNNAVLVQEERNAIAPASLQDSLDRMSKRYSEIIDSLNRANKITKEKTNDAVLVPEERNAIAPASLQDSLDIMSKRYSEVTDSLTRASKITKEKTNDAVLVPEERNAIAPASLQDSLDIMSKRYSEITDSLTRASKITKEKTNDAVLVPEERNAIAPARMQEFRNEPDTKQYQRMQDQQDQMYRQYARQAEALSRDIDRLNNRLVNERRNDGRNSNYIPVPIPINNSRNQEPARVATPTKTDTIYVRDSVLLRDSVILRDSIRIDTLILPAEAFISRPLPEVTRIDTVLVKETITQPSFDYASLPEENILFALGQSSFQPIYENKLDFIAGILLRNTGLQVRITGHTDSTGSRAVNEKLSLQRAENVANYLLQKGVSQTQILVTSETFKNPAVTGNTKSARSQNRRVTLKLDKLPE